MAPMQKFQTKPAARPAQQPGAMLQRARGLAVGGAQPRALPTKPMAAPGGEPDADEAPMVSVAGHAPVFNAPGQQLGTLGPGGPGPQNLQPPPSPPIFAGGQQPGMPPSIPFPTMDGAPGAMPPPGAGPDIRPTGQHPLNPAAGAPDGLPPGMQLPPQLQQAVQAGRIDPQQAFDRAMQNRAGFRQQVMAQQQPPPQQNIRNLSDIYRRGLATPAISWSKPLPSGDAGGMATLSGAAASGGIIPPGAGGGYRY